MASDLNRLALGWRKTGYWLASNALMVWGAMHFKGTFAEFRDGVLVLAAAVLGAHTWQNLKTPRADAEGK